MTGPCPICGTIEALIERPPEVCGSCFYRLLSAHGRLRRTLTKFRETVAAELHREFCDYLERRRPRET